MRTSRAACLVSLLAAGCGAPVGPADPRVFEAARAGVAAQEPKAAPGDVRYSVVAGPGADELYIVADVPGTAQRLHPLPYFAPYVHDAAVERGGAWQPLASLRGDLACGAPRCRVRYRVALRASARGLDRLSVAQEDRGVLFVPPSSWLLAFDGLGAGARYRALVQTTPPVRFVSGVFHATDEPLALEGPMSGLRDTPYAAFGELRVHPLALPGGTLEIALTPGSTGVPEARLVAWMEENARAVAAYFGRFPAPRALVLVKAGSGGTIGDGRTTGDGGASLVIDVGRDTTERDLREDWVFVHELCHVAFPNVGRPWAEEGLSTYVEPLVRVRAGLLDADKVWGDLLRGLPEGLPEAGDRGLDRTDTWGRRYWGGALFWFTADVEIRRRTNNARSLDDALRAIIAAGGNVGATWPLEEALRVGDAAVGVPVFAERYAAMVKGNERIDLDALFAHLGVRRGGAGVVYDDAAPLAAVRRGITARR